MKTFSLKYVALIFISVGVLSLNSTSASEFEYGGYSKLFILASQNPKIGGNAAPSLDSFDGLITNTLRLKAGYSTDKAVSFGIAYALIPQISIDNETDLFSMFPLPDPYSYRAVDFRQRIYPDSTRTGNSFALWHNLDRLNISFRTSVFDITLGRQAISFGSARVINPLNILSPYTFSELDKEEIVGIDALRIRFPVGQMGEIDIGYVFGKDGKFSNSAFFTNLKTYILNTDINISLIGFRENLSLGIDVSRSLAGASVWLASTYTLAAVFDDYESEDNYVRVTVGIDYSLAKGLYGFLEYHFNGAGKIKSSDYYDLFERTAFNDGSVFLLGMHYISPGVIWEINPLLHLTSEVILNCNDPSMWLSVLFQYSLIENVLLIWAFLKSSNIK